MKIAIFDPYLDTLGGGEKYMLTAAACLSQIHEVTLFWADKQIKDKILERFKIDLSRVSFKESIFSTNVSFAKRMIESLSYDVIFYLSDGSIPLVIPNKLIIHFQFPVEWVSGNNILTQLKLRFSRGIICNSFFTKAYIDKKFHVNSSVLYPPSDVSAKLTVTKTNTILTVGRLSISNGSLFKKQDFLIRAFKEMIDNGLKGWKFILCISYMEKDREAARDLKKLADGYPIEIIENCSNIELAEYYSQAKIYWHAAGFGEDITIHPEKAEHFGIATVEAMAKGAVPIVINAGGQKEIVTNGENGLLWNTEKELIKQTTQVIKNITLQKKLAENAMKSSQKYSEDAFCQSIQKIMS